MNVLFSPWFLFSKKNLIESCGLEAVCQTLDVLSLMGMSDLLLILKTFFKRINI
jgi:hypothetical protein